MRIKNLTLLTLGGGVTMWLLAGLWHKVIMVQFYIDKTDATREGTGIILLAYFILAALMAWLYPVSTRVDNRSLKA